MSSLQQNIQLLSSVFCALPLGCVETGTCAVGRCFTGSETLEGRKCRSLHMEGGPKAEKS